MADDPLVLFDDWFAEAKASEPNDPEAVALATATADGRPSLRMVLMKGNGPDGFSFFTNRDSRKGDQDQRGKTGAAHADLAGNGQERTLTQRGSPPHPRAQAPGRRGREAQQHAGHAQQPAARQPRPPIPAAQVPPSSTFASGSSSLLRPRR